MSNCKLLKDCTSVGIFTVWVTIKFWIEIMYRNGLFLNYANIARSIQTYLNKQTGEEAIILLFKQMQRYWCWMTYVQNKNHSQFKDSLFFFLSGHVWRFTQRRTTWVRHRCGVSLNTVEQSIVAVQHVTILASPFSPSILDIIIYQDTFLEVHNSWFSACNRKLFFSHHLVLTLQLHRHIQ